MLLFNPLERLPRGLLRSSIRKITSIFYSKFLMDPVSGISYDEPQPNTFSFNSPYGACERCDGLGYIFEVDEHSVIPNRKLSIMQGGLLHWANIAKPGFSRY